MFAVRLQGSFANSSPQKSLIQSSVSLDPLNAATTHWRSWSTPAKAKPSFSWNQIFAFTLNVSFSSKLKMGEHASERSHFATCFGEQ